MFKSLKNNITSNATVPLVILAITAIFNNNIFFEDNFEIIIYFVQVIMLFSDIMKRNEISILSTNSIFEFISIALAEILES